MSEMAVKPETKEFMTRMGGALGAGVADAALEAVYNSNPTQYADKFPYIALPNPLPPLDDWLILGGSAAVYAVGKWRKKSSWTKVGEGALLYSVPMILWRIIIRSMPPYTTTTARFVPVTTVRTITTRNAISIAPTPASSTGKYMLTR